ncbi:hypothetical protein ACFL20_10205 [Spirochaetota bacterium]
MKRLSLLFLTTIIFLPALSSGKTLAGVHFYSDDEIKTIFKKIPREEYKKVNKIFLKNMKEFHGDKKIGNDFTIEKLDGKAGWEINEKRVLLSSYYVIKEINNQQNLLNGLYGAFNIAYANPANNNAKLFKDYFTLAAESMSNRLTKKQLLSFKAEAVYYYLTKLNTLSKKVLKNTKLTKQDHILLYATSYTYLCLKNKLLKKFFPGSDRLYIVKEYMKIINFPPDKSNSIKTGAAYDYLAAHNNDAGELITTLKHPELVQAVAYLTFRKSINADKAVKNINILYKANLLSSINLILSTAKSDVYNQKNLDAIIDKAKQLYKENQNITKEQHEKIFWAYYSLTFNLIKDNKFAKSMRFIAFKYDLRKRGMMKD